MRLRKSLGRTLETRLCSTALAGSILSRSTMARYPFVYELSQRDQWYQSRMCSSQWSLLMKRCLGWPTTLRHSLFRHGILPRLPQIPTPKRGFSKHTPMRPPTFLRNLSTNSMILGAEAFQLWKWQALEDVHTL